MNICENSSVSSTSCLQLNYSHHCMWLEKLNRLEKQRICYRCHTDSQDSSFVALVVFILFCSLKYVTWVCFRTTVHQLTPLIYVASLPESSFTHYWVAAFCSWPFKNIYQTWSNCKKSIQTKYCWFILALLPQHTICVQAVWLARMTDFLNAHGSYFRYHKSLSLNCPRTICARPKAEGLYVWGTRRRRRSEMKGETDALLR